ncbi:DUF202 domain-containing protein [Kitasatospora sp. NPDC056184]|uniref:DUF202 domain-containing protein n=1 Tax=Kitasatospora sp. NPDC056184 TaxID=3345738 RepID=UPI0035DDF0A7
MKPRQEAGRAADPGLQPERTALARRRTALSALVTAVLALRCALTHRSPADTAAGLLLVAVAALCVAPGLGTRAGRAATAVCAGAAGLLIAVQGAVRA